VKLAPGTIAAGVLGVLATSAGRLVTADVIVAALWDDPPPSARNAIQVAVSKLRDVIGREFVATAPGGYRLGAALARVDVLEVEELLTSAREFARLPRWTEVLQASDSIIALVAGIPLGAVRSAWAERLRDRTAGHAFEATILRAQALLALTRADESVDCLLPLVAERPLEERAVVVLARAYMSLGRTADALHAHEALRSRLAEELGVDPAPDTQSAFLQLLTGDPPRTLDSVPVIRLPPTAGPTWGRDEVAESVTQVLTGDRKLVTVVGPGGMGKTRLAIIAARAIAGTLHCSAWFVDLVPCVDHTGVRAALDSTIDPLGSDYEAVLRTGTHLVVLDNAEQLIEIAGELASALVGLGDVRVLTTSRTPLNVPDERVFWLSQLQSNGRNSPAALMLVDRARTWLDPSSSDIEVLTQLAARVDGVPLALELLSAALRWRSPADLVIDFVSELTAVSHGGGRADRHASVTAAIEWNVRHADEHVRRGLGALLVLAGSFSVAAASEILIAAIPEAAPRQLLTSLVDLSLVQRLAGSGEVRLRVLEPVRIAAEGHPLVGCPDRRAYQAHSRFYLHQVVQAVDALEFTDAPVVDIYRQDDQNVTAAIEWAWANKRETAVESLGHLMYYWYIVVRGDSLMRWTDILERQGMPDSPAAARCAIAVFRWHTAEGRPDRAAPYREIGLLYWDALSIEWQYRWTFSEGERLRLLNQLEAAADIWGQLPEHASPRGQASKAICLAIIALNAGDYRRAAALLDNVLAEGLTIGQPSIHVYALADRAYVGVITGEHDRAEALVSQAVSLAQATTIRDDFVLANNVLGWVQLSRNQPTAALMTIAVSGTTLGSSDDLLFATEIALIGALALEACGAASECQRAADFLWSIRSESPPGMLDRWAEQQTSAFLERWPASIDDPLSFKALCEHLDCAAERLAAV